MTTRGVKLLFKVKLKEKKRYDDFGWVGFSDREDFYEGVMDNYSFSMFLIGGKEYFEEVYITIFANDIINAIIGAKEILELFNGDVPGYKLIVPLGVDIKARVSLNQGGCHVSISGDTAYIECKDIDELKKFVPGGTK
jgi:hypothetical protein